METSAYTKANFRQGAEIAKDFELTVQYAMNARRRFLNEELELIDLEIAFYDDYEGDVLSEHFSLRQYSFLSEERAKIKQELRGIKNVTIRKPGITDEMIEQARNYPVDKLIEFIRGNAIAFCHNDKRPSMFHGTRTNTAQCPVCGKSFDSIAILMERDNMDFKTAVLTLCR